MDLLPKTMRKIDRCRINRKRKVWINEASESKMDYMFLN